MWLVRHCVLSDLPTARRWLSGEERGSPRIERGGARSGAQGRGMTTRLGRICNRRGQARTTQPRGHVTQLSPQQPPGASREEYKQSGPDCYPPLSDPYPVPPTLGVLPRPSGLRLAACLPQNASPGLSKPHGRCLNKQNGRLSVIFLAETVPAPPRPPISFRPQKTPGCSARRFLPPSLLLRCSLGHPPPLRKRRNPPAHCQLSIPV